MAGLRDPGAALPASVASVAPPAPPRRRGARPLCYVARPRRPWSLP